MLNFVENISKNELAESTGLTELGRERTHTEPLVPDQLKMHPHNL